jgi:hypothetical protein
VGFCVSYLADNEIIYNGFMEIISQLLGLSFLALCAYYLVKGFYKKELSSKRYTIKGIQAQIISAIGLLLLISTVLLIL